MKAFKGFNNNLQCDPTGHKPFQYEVGGTYEEASAEVCQYGFHACENPMDVLKYYPPGKNRYCEVELDGVSKRQDESDSKIAGTKIKIGVEVGLKGIIQGALRFIFERTQESSDTTSTTGNRAHAATTGYAAHAATTGDDAHAATTGNRAHAATTGNRAHAATTGDAAHAATTGDDAHAATTGNRAHAATTGDDAHAATTGNRAHAATTGNRAHAATTGNRAHAEVKGKNAIAASLGIESWAKGGIGSYIVCADWQMDKTYTWQLMGVKAAKVDGINILPDVFYTLRNSEFVEVR